MPEYDAFGREIGEDPLIPLRDATAEKPSVRADAPPVAEPTPVEAEPPRPAEPVVARPAPAGRGTLRAATMPVILIVSALVAGVALLGAFAQDQLEGLAEPVPGDVGTPPAGLDRRSLLRPANFAAGLELLRRSGKGRPVTLRIAAGQIDATLAGPVGISQVQVTADQRLTTLGSTDSGAFPPTIPYARIDPTAPDRLVRSARTPARRVDHVQLLPGRPVRWRAVFRGGETVTGDAAGRP